MESSKDKTKRKFRKYLESYPWDYQVSIFYDSNGIEALEDSSKLRKRLSRVFDNTMLYRLCLRHTDWKGENAYMMFFISGEIDIKEFKKEAERVIGGDINIKHRTVTPEKIDKYTSAVKNQKPHDLNRFFGKSKINRLALLNAKP